MEKGVEFLLAIDATLEVIVHEGHHVDSVCIRQCHLGKVFDVDETLGATQFIRMSGDYLADHLFEYFHVKGHSVPQILDNDVLLVDVPDDFSLTWRCKDAKVVI